MKKWSHSRADTWVRPYDYYFVQDAIIIPITKNNYPKEEEIPAQGRDGNLGGQDGKLGGRMAIFLRLCFYVLPHTMSSPV